MHASVAAIRSVRIARVNEMSSKPTNPIEEYLRGWPVLGIAIATFLTSQYVFSVFHHNMIVSLYGSEDWHNGLRVVDNKGSLSDGSSLSGLPLTLLYLGPFVVTAVLVFWHCDRMCVRKDEAGRKTLVGLL